jgi:transposase-like protein
MVLRRLHTWEFKEDIVARANEEGAFPPDIAREAGINPSMLQRWMKEKAAGKWEGHPTGAVLNMPKRKYKTQQVPATVPTKTPIASNDQVDKLRQKIDFLTKENDLLRKMVALYITLQS